MVRSARLQSIHPANTAVISMLLTVNVLQLISCLPLPTLLTVGSLFRPQDEEDLDGDEDLAGALDLVFKLAVERSFPIFQQFINTEPPNIPGAMTFLKTYLMEDLWIMSVWTCVLQRIRDRVHTLPSDNNITVYVVREHTAWSSNGLPIVGILRSGKFENKFKLDRC